jgi:predicted dehydrogenase
MPVTVKTLALVGAGNIGSRHLQSLADLDQEWKIVVIEPDAKSMATAQLRYKEVVGRDSPESNYFASLDSLPAVLDICILATPAAGRLEVINEILVRSKCRYMILEKIVFQSPVDFSTAEELFTKHRIDVWVNCPRRLWPMFKELKKSLVSNEQIQCNFVGEKFAMASNAIHLIDLFQFLTGCSEIIVDGTKLSPPYNDKRRVGSLEFSDTLIIRTAKGDTFELTRVDTGKPVSSIMTTKAGTLFWSFKQYESKVAISSEASGWEMIEEHVDVPLQSALTASVVRDLAKSGTCGLPKLSESRLAHEAMLKAFFDRIERATGHRPEYCNIT